MSNNTPSIDFDNEQFYNEVLEYIYPNVTAPAFESFIEPVKLREISRNPNIAYLESLKEMVVKVVKRRYKTIFEEAFSDVFGEEFKVVIKTTSEYNEKSSLIEKEDSSMAYYINFSQEKISDPNFTFDNFVVAECNDVAAAICKAVAESPADLYNPLFIYGGSGLGKTHLLNAICIHLLEHNKDLKILYVTAETFTMDFLNALEYKKTEEFKQKYRRADVLLMDDIEFLENKLKTQDEFFNTFEALLQNNKQVIVSGDRPPNSMTSADDRLVSRLLMNTTAGLYPPDYETRIAILHKHADLLNIEITDEVNEIIEFIADKFKDNIRLLVGGLKNVKNLSVAAERPFTLSFAKEVLRDIVKGGGTITPQKIKSVVAKHYNIKISDLESTSRKATFAYPRQIAMYLCRTMTDYSLPGIGDIFGNKHYSTVKYACDKIEEEISVNKELKEEIESLKNKISSL